MFVVSLLLLCILLVNIKVNIEIINKVNSDTILVTYTRGDKEYNEIAFLYDL